MFNTGRMGLDTSARAMVARAVGAGDLPLANHIAQQSLLFNITLALVVMGMGIVISEWLLRILGIDETMVAEGVSYQQARFAASLFFGITMVSGSILQAGGDTFTPMKAQLVTRAIHLSITPILMFGWLGVPPMGIVGGAVANAISQAVGGSMNLYALWAGSSRLQVNFRDLRPDWPLLWQQIKLGAPASVTSAERAFALVLLTGLVAPFGAVALAVFAVIQRIQMFGGFGTQGLSMAGGIIVGQNLGAGQPARARATVWWALGVVFGVQVVLCTLMFAFPEAVIGIFSREPEVQELGALWLRIEVLGYMFFALGNTMSQVFNTAGDTLPPMLAMLGGLWIIELPIALILTGASAHWAPLGLQLPAPEAFNLGVIGMAWAGFAASSSRFVFLFGYFLRGPWYKKQIFGRPAPAVRV